MNTQNIVKIGASRQIAIPMKLWREMKLKSGKYLEIKRQGKGLFLQPKTLVDDGLEASLSQSFKDFEEGRSYGPFDTWEEFIESLHKESAKIRKERKSKKAQ